MKIQELKASLNFVSAVETTPFYYLHGVVEFIDDKHFKLFQNPDNRSSYVIIPIDSVLDELHEWSAEALAYKGFVGHAIYRVPVQHGASVQVVSVTPHKLGETLSADIFQGALAGTCNSSSGCGSKKCCTTETDGKCYCDDCCIA